MKQEKFKNIEKEGIEKPEGKLVRLKIPHVYQIQEDDQC